MKSRITISLDEALVAFVDSESGKFRSAKIGAMLRLFRDARREQALRAELGDFTESADDEAESVAWRLVMRVSED